jgi:glycosyltransferase involved in cell wall biosynthesis
VPGVVVNARAAARPELGGVERWARELAVRLPALRPDRYAVWAPRPRLVHRAGHAWEQVVLPARATLARAELLLGPANLAPLAFGRNVVVVHDVAALRHPGWYAPAYVAWQRALLPRIARRARLVVTVSEFSRRELRDLLGVDAVVVPGGVGEAFRPDADPAPARALLGLERPYVLTVASRTARKNLGALAETARRLAADGVELVAAGGDRPQFQAEPEVAGVRSVGRVDEALLPGLYAGAEAFVLPSVYEGFGLPVLEAMAAGVPVVAADAAALPETSAGAALLADPGDQRAVAEAVAAAMDRKQELRASGLARAAGFSWEATARALDAEIGALLTPVPVTLAPR